MSNNKDFVARVIATHGKHSFVEDKTGKIFEAIRRGKKKDVVVGDLVKCKQSSDEQVAIESVEERKSLLYRSDEFRTKPLAANIDQVALVFATRPTYNPRFIWKAILAAETANIPMLIIRNKTDITEDDNQVRPFIDQLKELGCSIVEVSATAYPKETEQKLFPLFEHRITLLIGQSGMGKSTILNLLVKDAEQKTQEYSKALNLGKQTTTSTRWFQFGNDGAIVDSPGFQEFGLAHLTLNDIMRGFPEIKERVEYCRFTNCRHLEEPQCAVKAAVENHDIDPERYALYKELAEETLRPKNY
ncbi:ribosome small subunit-dependent GTPase A [Turicimonas muris]|uniref:ribosome small subunit-dependent GTPase A n=3 Tax=Turicimonas muris TaxID=1796652 RepID=UPI0023F2D5BF|nr:ribosome small subunit-dependent GTPase A [Turicimonas muris]MBS4767968.1 ribosome small subunit-dependent GTPase A [Burkholderiales bacterium]